MTESNAAGTKTRLQRVWAFFKRPSSMSWSVLVAAGVVAGVVLWGGFNWTIELTGTEAFCVSCHEMRDTVYPELQKTIHWKNKSGVRAICSDCHVPKPWIYKVKRKIEASHEVLHKILGTIDTKEKFEAHRLELAQNVWASMKATDSRECRNCHSVDSMDPHKQSAAAQMMSEAIKNGATCIDCHKGIAHTLPKDPDAANAAVPGVGGAFSANTSDRSGVDTLTAAARYAAISSEIDLDLRHAASLGVDAQRLNLGNRPNPTCPATMPAGSNCQFRDVTTWFQRLDATAIYKFDQDIVRQAGLNVQVRERSAIRGNATR